MVHVKKKGDNNGFKRSDFALVSGFVHLFLRVIHKNLTKLLLKEVTSEKKKKRSSNLISADAFIGAVPLCSITEGELSKLASTKASPRVLEVLKAV